MSERFIESPPFKGRYKTVETAPGFRVPQERLRAPDLDPEVQERIDLLRRAGKGDEADTMEFMHGHWQNAEAQQSSMFSSFDGLLTTLTKLHNWTSRIFFLLVVPSFIFITKDAFLIPLSIIAGVLILTMVVTSFAKKQNRQRLQISGSEDPSNKF